MPAALMPDESFYSLSAQTLYALDEAREKIAAMLQDLPSTEPGMDAQIRACHARIETAWQHVYRITRAIARDFFTITPPSDTDLARAGQIGDNLHNMTATVNNTNALVTSVNDIMEIWTRTNPTKRA